MRSWWHIRKIVQYYEHFNDCTQRIEKRYLDSTASRYLIALFAQIYMCLKKKETGITLTI